MKNGRSTRGDDPIPSEGEPLPSEGELRSVDNLVKQLDKLLDEQEKASLVLSTINKQIYTLTHDTIPDILQAAGMRAFSMIDGRTIEIKDYLNASVPNADDDPEANMKAMSWVERNHPDIIKHQIGLAFTRDEEERVEKLKAILIKNKFDHFTDKEEVHHSTLSATFRQRRDKGQKTPYTLFKVNMGTHAVVKQPPKPRKVR